MLNGRAIDKDLMVRISGFVPQQDLAVSCLTALEHLNFIVSLTIHIYIKSKLGFIVEIKGLYTLLYLEINGFTSVSKVGTAATRAANDTKFVTKDV